MTMALEEYLELPYTIELVHDRDDRNEGWFAQVKELPGCMSQGATIDEAVENLRDAMAGWISVAIEDGMPIPEPRAPASFSGRLLLRIPRGLHAELSRQAEDEGVSLNQYIATLLAGAAKWVGRADIHDSTAAERVGDAIQMSRVATKTAAATQTEIARIKRRAPKFESPEEQG
jgi:antitoxin HicB